MTKEIFVFVKQGIAHNKAVFMLFLCADYFIELLSELFSCFRSVKLV
jgi:hypothetical protein